MPARFSDFFCCLYGVPGAYGVVTLPFSVREGINIFLAGYIPTENLRFREMALSFKVAENANIYKILTQSGQEYHKNIMNQSIEGNHTLSCFTTW